jgi:hypothetical protein
MFKNFIIAMLILLLNFSSLSLAQDLNHYANNALGLDPVNGLFSEDGVCTNEGIFNWFVDPLGLSGSGSGSVVSFNELRTDTTYDVLEASQSFITTNEAYTPGIELKKYISGIRFGMGRSFGVNFWVWEDLGLGFVLDRGDPALQVLNHPSENLLLGPRYRF